MGVRNEAGTRCMAQLLPKWDRDPTPPPHVRESHRRPRHPCSKPRHRHPFTRFHKPTPKTAPPPPLTGPWQLEGLVVKEKEGARAQEEAKGKKEEVANPTCNLGHSCMHNVLSALQLFRALSFHLSLATRCHVHSVPDVVHDMFSLHASPALGITSHSCYVLCTAAVPDCERGEDDEGSWDPLKDIHGDMDMYM